jgi:SAM-dependent methyltransferase
MTLGDPDKVYGKCYSDPYYEMKGHRKDELRDFLRGRSGSYLDVSCGRGEGLDLAESFGLGPLRGYELPSVIRAAGNENDSRILEYADIMDLPEEPQSWDIVACHDVLEHLPEPRVDGAIERVWEATRGVLHLTIGTGLERYGEDRGLGQLHVTVHPPAWWSDRIERVTGVKPVDIPPPHLKKGYYPCFLERA